MIIEPMRFKDIEAVVQIETTSFANPWHKISFINELHQPHSRNYIIRPDTERVGQSADPAAAIGFICYHLICDELHLLKIAVKPDYRRKGFAEKALRTCFELEAATGVTAGVLEVRQSNTAGIRLYQKMGFDVIGIRPYYYIRSDNQYEDAIIMKKHF